MAEIEVHIDLDGRTRTVGRSRSTARTRGPTPWRSTARRLQRAHLERRRSSPQPRLSVARQGRVVAVAGLRYQSRTR